MLTALLISLFAAVVPTIIYVLIFYWADRHEREPIWLVTIAFWWGAIPAIFVSLLGELIIGVPFVNAPGSVAEAIVEGAVVAPFVEEVIKGIALLGIFWWMRKEFDGVLDGLLYGALVGFGFAMTENFLYFIGAFNEGGYANLTIVIFLRAIIFGLNHAFYTGLYGIGLGLARNASSVFARTLWPILGLFGAILAHSLHNFGSSVASINALGLLLSLLVAVAGIGVVALTIALAWKFERSCIRSELLEEVGYTLSEEEYHFLINNWQRSLRLRNPLDQAQDRRMQLFAELALGKRRLRDLGPYQEPELPNKIARIRAELTAPYSV